MKYIIYARKSTESEDRQTLSIQSQVIEMQEVAKREGLEVVRVFEEAKSAKAPGRPVFAEMLRFIERGKASGILCWKIDRLARNPVDEGTLKWYLQNRTIETIKTFDRDYQPDDNVVIASIEFSMANQYIRDLSRNVKRGLAEKVRRGEYPGARPIGYVTDPKTRLMVIDKEMAPLAERAFYLYANEDIGTDRLADKLYAEGFRSRGGYKVGKSTIHRMLTNPIYAGLFRWKGQIYKGVHEAIISLTLFEAVEKKFQPKLHLKAEQKVRVFTYRGFLVCGECGLKVTAEIKKGHTYYRCTKSRGVEACSQRYTREEELEKVIGEELARIRLDADVLDLIVAASKEKITDKERLEGEAEERLTRLLEEVKARKDSLIEKFIDNALPKEIYDEKYAEIVKEEAGIEEKLEEVRSVRAGLLEDIEMAVRFVKTAHRVFTEGDKAIRREVVDILASNIGVENRKVAYINLNDPFTWLREDVETILAEMGGNDTFEPKNGGDDGLSKTKTEASASVRSRRLGRKGSNLRMVGPEPTALPLGYSPKKR